MVSDGDHGIASKHYDAVEWQAEEEECVADFGMSLELLEMTFRLQSVNGGEEPDAEKVDSSCKDAVESSWKWCCHWDKIK
jgi:hypothetical protein